MKKHLILIGLLLITSINSNAQLKDISAGLASNSHIYSLVIIKNDKEIYSHYFNGHTQTDLMNDQSLTKSICSILIGIAIEQGYLKSADQKIVDFFPDLNDDPDKRKQEITIRNIMNQASGLYHEDLNKLYEFLSQPMPFTYVLKSDLISEPGKIFHYNNAATHLLSVILTKATGMDTYTFAKKNLFEPMGISHFEWAKMKDGYYDGCGLLSIRLRSADMAKVGNMILNRGQYNNKQIIPAMWANELLQPKTVYQTTWGFDHSTYALCYYHTNYKGTQITYGMGWGGQFLLLIPSMNMVIVTNQDTADETAIQQSNNFIDRIFPAIFQQAH